MKRALQGAETIPCYDLSDATNLLRTQTDNDLPTPLSYICHKPSSYANGNTFTLHNIPTLIQEVSATEFLDLLQEHGRLLANGRLIKGELDPGIYIGYTEEWSQSSYQYSPSKVRQSKMQSKYYRRSRMRKGDVPIHIPSSCFYAISTWLHAIGFGGWVRGTGSTFGVLGAFNHQYQSLKDLRLLPDLRKSECRCRWDDAIETASHYVKGLKTFGVDDNYGENTHFTDLYRQFGIFIEEECNALDFPIPTYVKGAKYD